MTIALGAKGIRSSCQRITLLLLSTSVQAVTSFCAATAAIVLKTDDTGGSAHMVVHAKRFLRLS